MSAGKERARQREAVQTLYAELQRCQALAQPSNAPGAPGPSPQVRAEARAVRKRLATALLSLNLMERARLPDLEDLYFACLSGPAVPTAADVPAAVEQVRAKFTELMGHSSLANGIKWSGGGWGGASRAEQSRARKQVKVARAELKHLVAGLPPHALRGDVNAQLIFDEALRAD